MFVLEGMEWKNRLWFTFLSLALVHVFHEEGFFRQSRCPLGQKII